MAKKSRSTAVATAPVRRGGSTTPLARFMALFTGYSKAYGQFEVKKAGENGKVQGRAVTMRGAPGAEQYQAHLAGTGPGLGIVMLRDDDTVSFGAIDYDVKTMDHVKAEAAVRQLALPLVLCRSKSGGGHFYCFTQEPVAASVMRDRLAEWTALLGMAAKTEQFPKQAARFNDDDIGSWINLPYYQAEATMRYALKDGVALSLEEFLDYAESMRVSTELLHTPATTAALGNDVVPGSEADLFYEGPPCLQMIAAKGGFEEGGRNNGMTAVVVYLKKRYPDSWQTKVDAYNMRMAQLPSGEVQTIIKSHTRKDYDYQCKQPPINAFCQRRKCMGCAFGVGEAGPDSKGVTLASITRYNSPNGDEPIWFLDVNGTRVMVTNAQLYSRDEFNRACMAQANVVPVHVPPQRWLKMLNEMISTAEVITMPDDAGPTGQLMQWVESFLTANVNAATKEEVVLGKPYRDHEAKRVYFRSLDLFRYLDARKVPYKSPQAVWAALRERGGDTSFWKVDGKGLNVWHLPMPEGLDDKPQAVPDIKQTDAF